jgi:cytochrome c2
MRRKLVTVTVVLAAGISIMLYDRLTLASRGEQAFTRLGCGGCHFSGGGPNLTHVVRRHDEKLLRQFIQNPGAVYRARNNQPLNPGYMYMPNMNATAEDAEAIVAYLKNLDKQQQ